VKDLDVWIRVISHNVEGFKLMANSYKINLNANPVYKHIQDGAVAVVPLYSYILSILQLTSVHL
jgi:hypothetical protein